MPQVRFPPITGNPDLDRWLVDLRAAFFSEGLTEFIHGWIADSRQTVTLGTLPENAYIVRAHCHVTEAFDSGGTDTLTIGWDSDPDAITTSIDVSTTGQKICPFGVGAGFNSDSREVKGFYTAGGSAPTTGKALLVIEFFRAEKAIS